MQITSHQIQHCKIAEISHTSNLFATEATAVQLIGECYYQGYDAIIVYKENIHAAFFDLSSGIAGAILQKFSNYQLKLAIIGDFSQVQSMHLNDFIKESNKHQHINFVSTLLQGLQVLG